MTPPLRRPLGAGHGALSAAVDLHLPAAATRCQCVRAPVRGSVDSNTG